MNFKLSKIIIEETAEEFNVLKESLTVKDGRYSDKQTKIARQIMLYLHREILKIPYSKISAMTTNGSIYAVRYAINTTTDVLSVDSELKRKMMRTKVRIRRRLNRIEDREIVKKEFIRKIKASPDFDYTTRSKLEKLFAA